MRAISAHCRATGTPPPPLRFALVGDDQIELVLAEAVADAPVGFTVEGRSWQLSAADAGYLASVPGISESPRPWPALVTLGRDDRDRQVLADLESLRLLHLDPAAAFDAEGVLAAMAVELSFSPWADEMILTLMGRDVRLPAALGKHNVTQTDDLDGCSTGWSSGPRCNGNTSRMQCSVSTGSTPTWRTPGPQRSCWSTAPSTRPSGSGWRRFSMPSPR